MPYTNVCQDGSFLQKKRMLRKWILIYIYILVEKEKKGNRSAFILNQGFQFFPCHKSSIFSLCIFRFSIDRRRGPLSLTLVNKKKDPILFIIISYTRIHLCEISGQEGRMTSVTQPLSVFPSPWKIWFWFEFSKGTNERVVVVGRPPPPLPRSIPVPNVCVCVSSLYSRVTLWPDSFFFLLLLHRLNFSPLTRPVVLLWFFFVCKGLLIWRGSVAIASPNSSRP